MPSSLLLLSPSLVRVTVLKQSEFLGDICVRTLFSVTHGRTGQSLVPFLRSLLPSRLMRQLSISLSEQLPWEEEKERGTGILTCSVAEKTGQIIHSLKRSLQYHNHHNWPRNTVNSFPSTRVDQNLLGARH